MRIHDEKNNMKWLFFYIHTMSVVFRGEDILRL